MTLCIALLLGAIFFYREIFKPTIQYFEWVEDRDYREELKIFKYKVVREFYPSLREYSLSEIEQKWGLSSVYETVGKPYLRRRNRQK